MKPEGMLVLIRSEGRAIFIGRKVILTVEAIGKDGKVTLDIKGSRSVAGNVYRVNESIGVQLGARERVTIDTVIQIRLLEVNGLRDVRIGIEAPRWMAVSRDDTPYEGHLRWQDLREQKAVKP